MFTCDKCRRLFTLHVEIYNLNVVRGLAVQLSTASRCSTVASPHLIHDSSRIGTACSRGLADFAPATAGRTARFWRPRVTEAEVSTEEAGARARARDTARDTARSGAPHSTLREAAPTEAELFMPFHLIPFFFFVF